MTRVGRIASALALATSACTPLRTHVSSEVVWTPADEEALVAPGDILRVESTAPVRITSIFKSAQGEASVTETLTPKDGVVLFRPSLGTTSVRFPPGGSVHTGAPKDPEIAWFTLEDEAVNWAKSPLGTPFPAISQARRIDVVEMAELDVALRESKASADAITAMRSLVALRAIHAIEGVRSYPYARNNELTFTGTTSTRDIQDRSFAQISPGKNATITLEGPTALGLSTRMVRGASDVLAEVRVREGTRQRGGARAVVHHLLPEGEPAKTDTLAEGREPPDPTLAPLRRLFIHVPPGRHTYEIETIGAPAWIAGTDSAPYVLTSDALTGRKHQTKFASEGKESCGAACAIALVLAGEDSGPAYEQALAAASPKARVVAEKLAAGAPNDRAARLESDASSGDPVALNEIAKEAADTIDTSVRDAWWRGTLRGTSWQTLEDPTPPTWFAFLPREAADKCGGKTAPTEHELDANLVVVKPEAWRRVQTVRLLAVGACTPGEPIQIEVNGQKLEAQPSSARALWHIAVPAAQAKIRRLDKGATKVYALSDDACGGGTLIRAALPLSAPRAIVYPPGTTAPGVEVWVKAGSSDATLSIGSNNGSEKLDVTAHAGSGLAAVAEDGSRWVRAATVPLPAWGAAGVKITGAATVAIRAVARGIKSDLETKPTEHAQAPNVDALVLASKKLLAAKTNEARAAAALERGKLLASFGAERAAVEDGELAVQYGKSDGVDVVRRALLPPLPTPLETAAGAYGVESDFDPNAARCTVGDGPRAKITALDTQLRARPKSSSFDRNLAVQAATLSNAAPQDPRGETLVTLATTGSKWRLVRDVEGGGGRVVRPHEKDNNPILDSDARLRARIYAGDPYGNNFVSVSPDRPARAFVADVGNAKSRLDVVCIPRRVPAASEKCPLDVKMGEANVPIHLGEDGHASVDLPHGRGRGKGAELNVTLAQAHADYVALMRIVFDGQAPGTTKVEGVGWVLDTPHIQYRFVLPPGRPIRIRATQIGLLRLDAIPDGGEGAEVTASFAGHELPIPMTGDPKVVPIASAGEIVTVTSKGGTATIAVAERIESDSKFSESEPEPVVRAVETTTAHTSIDAGSWRDTAEKSPKPLGWFLDHLGTFESLTGVQAGTLRDGSPDNTAPDLYGFEQISYRRRIESINLFTATTALVRIRDGNPTYAGSFTFYEDLDRLRLRATGTLGAAAQEVGPRTEVTIKPRGFLEYSGRLATDLFLLPRIGYDGYFGTLANRPASSRDIDDDVYNAFRFERNNFVFLQALLWWVPFFDNIYYLRARGTYDIGNGAFSHAAVRPGSFFILGPVETGLYVDAQYFDRTVGARTSSGVDVSAGLNLYLHIFNSPGNFEIRPTVMAQGRADLGWSALGGITILGSARRGVRDYSSLELSFPESTGGGVPWRTEAKGP